MQSDKQVRNKILPSTVDECLREENLTLSQIRRVIPKQYLRPDSLRSWWELVRVLGCMIFCLYLLSLVRLGEAIELRWQVPALVSLWILYGKSYWPGQGVSREFGDRGSSGPLTRNPGTDKFPRDLLYLKSGKS